MKKKTQLEIDKLLERGNFQQALGVFVRSIGGEILFNTLSNGAKQIVIKLDGAVAEKLQGVEPESDFQGISRALFFKMLG